MPRPSSPWYRADRDAWVCTIDGSRVTLAKGKKNRAAAFREFQRRQAARGIPGFDAETITVGELVDRVLAELLAAVSTVPRIAAQNRSADTDSPSVIVKKSPDRKVSLDEFDWL